MRSIAIKLTIVAMVLAGTWYFRDSLFYARYSPAYGLHASGVIFYDRLRAQRGYYNVVNPYITIDACDVMNMEGELVYRFPRGFCYFFKDHSLMIINDRVSMFDPSGRLEWSREASFHHDFDVSQDEKQIFILSEDNGLEMRTDIVHGYDRHGHDIFDWKFNDHLDYFKNVMGHDFRPYTRRDLGPGVQVFSHLNSVQILPPNPMASKNPAFRAGNLLVNDFYNQIMFVIDRSTQNVVWSKRFKDVVLPSSDKISETGVHTVKMLVNGDLLFFHNGYSYEYRHQFHFSAIEEINPLTSHIVWRYLSDPPADFVSELWGSTYRLPDGHTLITDSAQSTAFEVEPNGRIVWQWVDPVKDDWGMPAPIYRVRRVAKSLVDPVVKAWKVND